MATTRASIPKAAHDLTPREHEVLALIVQGKQNQEIAAELMISVATVQNHVHRILSKLGCRSRVAVVSHVLNDEMRATK